MKLINYIKNAKNLIIWGVMVGLVLGVGVWMIALNDLGSRLATVGAFIVAILTPLIAFIANNFIPRKDTSAVADADAAPRNSRIIVVSALIAFTVAVGAVWAVPKVITTFQDYTFYSHDIETIDVDTIIVKAGDNMKDGDIANVTLPATKHRQLAISFDFKNNNSTNLCTNAATLNVSGPFKAVSDVRANSEQLFTIDSPSQPVTLKMELVFDPETDPSCRLDVAVKSALYKQ